MSDPYAGVTPGARRHFLYGLNPLAKIAAVVPAIVVLVFVRDLVTPAVFLVAAYLVLLAGARMTRANALLLFVAIPLGLALIGLGFAVWVDPAQVASSPVLLRVGGWMLHAGALQIGFATALRLGAILALSLIGGLTTSGPNLVRATVQQLRVPYRIGYTALAAFRFVPRFRYELGVIRAAHRVRGHHGGRGPFARLARGWGYIVPLLAGAIRHAERVALAMDSRAFGAYPTRTERYVVPWRPRDTVFLVASLAASVAVFWALFPWGIGG